MDFSLSEEHNAVIEAAQNLFSGMSTPERVAEIETTPDCFDRELYRALGSADLLGIGLSEANGGSGAGFVAAVLVLIAQGEAVAHLPLVDVISTISVLDRYGTSSLKERILPGAIDGNLMISVALDSLSRSQSGVPGLVVTKGEGGYTANGTESVVPFAHVADLIVVPAISDEGKYVLAFIPTSHDGVEVERVTVTNNEIHPRVKFRSVSLDAKDLIEANGDLAIGHLMNCILTGVSAIALGVSGAAIKQAADYLNEREQFGKPLSSLQGTKLKAADAAIDCDVMRATLLYAAWCIESNRDATLASAIAKWHASERGQRVVHSVQHLHGGVGADITYPIHRYFLWGKQIELMYGGPMQQLYNMSTLIEDSALKRLHVA